jgi:hypothetical protein
MNPHFRACAWGFANGGVLRKSKELEWGFCVSEHGRAREPGDSPPVMKREFCCG